MNPHAKRGCSLKFGKFVHGLQEVLAEYISLISPRRISILLILRVDLLQDVYPIAAIAHVVLLSVIFTCSRSL